MVNTKEIRTFNGWAASFARLPTCGIPVWTINFRSKMRGVVETGEVCHPLEAGMIISFHVSDKLGRASSPVRTLTTAPTPVWTAFPKPQQFFGFGLFRRDKRATLK